METIKAIKPGPKQMREDGKPDQRRMDLLQKTGQYF